MNAPSWPPTLPAPLRTLFARFPLVTHPAIMPPSARERIDAPVLWLAPPGADDDGLSADAACLRAQALVGLRGFPGARVRWDVHPAGALGGSLPNLHVPGGELLPATAIPAWLDEQLGALDDLEGFVDVAARDESRAWVALLEGHVDAALLAADPPPTTLQSLLATSAPPDALSATLATPPAPLFGFGAVLSSTTPRVPAATIEAEYAAAVGALSERLGADTWLLGSRAPTALDARLFAALHRALAARADVRAHVTRRVNLVAWERRVASLVRAAFRPPSASS